jgi:hypothetical protein
MGIAGERVGRAEALAENPAEVEHEAECLPPLRLPRGPAGS